MNRQQKAFQRKLDELKDAEVLFAIAVEKVEDDRMIRRVSPLIEALTERIAATRREVEEITGYRIGW